MSAPIPLEEAWERLFNLADPLAPEDIRIDDAGGRWLAADLRAFRTQPYADLSAMDGFAVSGPGPWALVGEARAGHEFDGELSPGQAVRISTGARCPGGTDGIVIVEEGEVAGETLTASPPRENKHIRRRGFDFSEGELLLAAGTRLSPAQIALARSGGHGLVPVARRPRVAIIECGDELVANPETCPPDKLPSSNGAMVAAMVRAASADADVIGPLPDARKELTEAVEAAGNADVIVTTAGASVGAHDHVYGALEDCGADITFWRVAIRPGKPLMVARLGKRIVIGLPGNPVSAYVTAFLFVLPLVRALQGAVRSVPAAITLPVSDSLPVGGDRREFWRSTFVDGWARPLPQRDSSALKALAQADLLIDRPAAAPEAPAGSMVSCYWLENGGLT
ncbi:molybdopterin molybdotransferase MoeA [Qipengyuania sp.]|uniref:molybdopterin molybdotransferase MoeA n=1 Tax=Qipengyuania sp. TaxID=2004515 RepID=UPI0035C8406E